MRWLYTTLLIPLLMAGAARAQEGGHFAVVDISADGRNEKVTAQIEKEMMRLRPGTKPLEDPAMRRLLATGEGPAAAASRLTREAEEQQAVGDCAGAVDRANQAETLTLSSVSLDDERELLRNIYTVLVICENELNHAAQRDAAAQRLRAMVSLPPRGLPTELWQKYVANATPPTATAELHVDSDPPNAQVAVNFHGEGVTPRTLKVPPGTVFVEVQKDGYLKAFRKLQVGTAPARTVFRLIDRTHDRLDQALATTNVLRRADAGSKPSVSTLSRLAQLSRADFLVLLTLKADHARIWFFDAEKGGLSSEAMESAVDLNTGKVAALSARGAPGAPQPAPAPPTGAAQPGAAAPAPSPAEPTPSGPAPTSATPAPKTVTTETPSEPPLVAQPAPTPVRGRKKSSAPWWSWLIAGAIGAGVLTFIYLDRPQREGTLAVRATWVPHQ
jgi:hypothetical protein